MQTFTYLLIDQRPADVVSFPDGTVEMHPAGSGIGVAADWNVAQEAPGEPVAEAPPVEPGEDEIQAALDDLTATWEAALAELERESSSFGSPESRRAAFLRRSPRPTRDHAVAKLRVPASRPRRRVVDDRSLAQSQTVDDCWWATLDTDLGGFDKPVDVGGPVPRRTIAKLLSQLSQEGWDVRHVSEERAAVHGREESKAVCVSVNVMLSRPSRP